MSDLPTKVNWPLLVAYLANSHGSQTSLAMRSGVSREGIRWYLEGMTVSPRFNNGLGFLHLVNEMSLGESKLQKTIGQAVMPDLPECVRWNEYARLIKQSYKKGEMMKSMSKAEWGAYRTASRLYNNRRSQPQWEGGVMLLNLARRQLTSDEYRYLTTVPTAVELEAA